MSQECPRCRLLSPDSAARCDCGYDFTTKTIQSSYLVADTVRKYGGEREFGEHTARQNIRIGVISLSVAAFVAVVSYLNSGTPSLFTVPVMIGVSFLYKG